MATPDDTTDVHRLAPVVGAIPEDLDGNAELLYAKSLRQVFEFTSVQFVQVVVGHR